MHKPQARWTGNRVDWDDDRLAALLKKTEGWTLDNRGTFDPRDEDEVRPHVALAVAGITIFVGISMMVYAWFM